MQLSWSKQRGFCGMTMPGHREPPCSSTEKAVMSTRADGSAGGQ
jgi:hypothetical protein